jgi:hypothetical protein
VFTVFQETPLIFLDVKNRPHPLCKAHVDHQRKALSKTELSAAERLQILSVVNAAEVAKVRDADDYSSKDDKNQSQTMFGSPCSENLFRHEIPLQS